jgi:hypothetical protein
MNLSYILLQTLFFFLHYLRKSQIRIKIKMIALAKISVESFLGPLWGSPAWKGSNVSKIWSVEIKLNSAISRIDSKKLRAFAGK